jgi:hypothetical protein
MEDSDKQKPNDYDMKKLLQQTKRQEEQQKRKDKKDKKQTENNEIQNLPDNADEDSKENLREGIKEAGKEAIQQRVKKMTKKATKKAAKTMLRSVIIPIIEGVGAFFAATWYIWVILIALFLLVALTVGLAKKACDNDLTKLIATTVFSISCEDPKAEFSGGASGGGGTSGDHDEENQEASDGCKSGWETMEGSGCGGDCGGFSTANIRSTQCGDASQSLTTLFRCMSNGFGDYVGLDKDDIKLTSVSDDKGLSNCRDNYNSSCAHMETSCHYKSDGSHAADIRNSTLTDTQQSNLKLLVESCGGHFLKEYNPDHIHISDSQCGGI